MTEPQPYPGDVPSAPTTVTPVTAEPQPYPGDVPGGRLVSRAVTSRVAINEPLTTIDELAVWVQLPRIPDDKIDFAMKILMGVAVVVRYAGDPTWTHDTIHPRAKLLADLKAKNFYEHPTGAVSETVGPLSERYLDSVVEQFVLTPEETALLASLVESTPDPTVETGVPGLWTLSTTRGPLETHPYREEVIYVPYWRDGSNPIPYYAVGALGSPW